MFQNIKVIAVTLFVLAFSILPAKASVITFDSLNTLSIEDGYGGLNWDGFLTLDTRIYTPYRVSMISPNRVSFSPGDSSISSSNAFNLNSAYFTSVWRDTLDISVIGYLEGVEKYSDNITINNIGPSFIQFDWAGVDSVVFLTEKIYNPVFAMDNLDISSVPVPAALPLFGLGLVGLSGFGRKRKRKEINLA